MVNSLFIGGWGSLEKQRACIPEGAETLCSLDAKAVVKFTKACRDAKKPGVVVLEYPTKAFFLDHELRYCLMSSHHWGVSFVACIEEGLELPTMLKASFDFVYTL